MIRKLEVVEMEGTVAAAVAARLLEEERAAVLLRPVSFVAVDSTAPLVAVFHFALVEEDLETPAESCAYHVEAPEVGPR